MRSWAYGVQHAAVLIGVRFFNRLARRLRGAADWCNRIANVVLTPIAQEAEGKRRYHNRELRALYLAQYGPKAAGILAEAPETAEGER